MLVLRPPGLPLLVGALASSPRDSIATARAKVPACSPSTVSDPWPANPRTRLSLSASSSISSGIDHGAQYLPECGRLPGVCTLRPSIAPTANSATREARKNLPASESPPRTNSTLCSGQSAPGGRSCALLFRVVAPFADQNFVHPTRGEHHVTESASLGDSAVDHAGRFARFEQLFTRGTARFGSAAGHGKSCLCRMTRHIELPFAAGHVGLVRFDFEGITGVEIANPNLSRFKLHISSTGKANVGVGIQPHF